MKKIHVFVIILAALMLSACGGQNQAAEAVAEPVQVEQEPAAVVEVQEEAPVVAEEQPVMAEPVVEEPAAASGTTSYTSPQGIFTLEVPAGWSMKKDTTSIDDSVIETFTSPDGHAYVQVLVNEVGPDISAVEKGQYTLDYMKRLCGSDLRVGKDVTLDDGRERLEWWSDLNVTSGTSYFDTKDNYLFFANMYYEDAYEGDYLPMLEEVADSFAY